MPKPYFLVEQHDDSDCGPACLLSLVQFYKGRSSLEDIRILSGTNVTGTTLLGLYQAAKQLDFNAEAGESDIESLKNYDRPCILHFRGNHFVICYGIIVKNNYQKFIIGDPGKGILYLNDKELEENWITKVYLEVIPNENFIVLPRIKKAKRNWIYKFLKQDISLLIVASILGVFIASLSLIMAFFSQHLIDDLLPKKNYSKLLLSLGLVFLLLSIRELFSFLRQHFLLQQSKLFNYRINNYFYEHLLELPKTFFDFRKTGEILARTNDTSRIQRFISQLIGSVIIDVLISLVSISLVIKFSPAIGIACIIFSSIFFFFIYKFNNIIVENQRGVMTNYALSDANFVSSIRGIEMIKGFNKQNYFSDKFHSLSSRYQNSIFRLGKIQIKLTFLSNILGVLFLSMIIAYASYQVIDGKLKIGELVAILTMCSTLIPSVAGLALTAIPFQEASIAFDRMFEFTESKSEDDDFGTSVDNFQSLSIKNLSFRYPGRRPILNGISFDVHKGQIISITGENGCGKSTLVNLICKNQITDYGKIVINGEIDLCQIRIQHWRSNLSTVTQNVHIFPGTVLENIAFEDALDHPEYVIEFLTTTGFTAFLAGLPQSIYTKIGEEGVNLSGGQKQIIALARALYRKPSILILDEATSAMDRTTEKFVLDLLAHLKEQMAIIFISHRLHALKNFSDIIYILKDGRFDAYGNHEQLIKSKNLYSLYWNDLIGTQDSLLVT